MDSARIVEMIRMLRHDFGNDLQVISGYIDIGQPQKSQAYIQGMVKQMEEERKIFTALEADYALYFFSQMLLVRELGVILKYDIIAIDSIELIMDRNEPYAALQRLCQQYPSLRDNEAKVSFTSDCEGIWMSVYADEIPESPLKTLIRE